MRVEDICERLDISRRNFYYYMDFFREAGFHVEVDGKYGHLTMDRSVPDLYSCHIEYEYLGKYGDCVDLNTLEDTWYIYPHGSDFSVTKMALATEELYLAHRRTIGRPCKPGLV